MTDMVDDLTPRRVRCKVEGCDRDAPQFGRFAGRCEEHRHSVAVANVPYDQEADGGSRPFDQEAQPEPGEYGHEEKPTIGSDLVDAAAAATEARDAFVAAEEAFEARLKELRDLIDEYERRA